MSTRVISVMNQKGGVGKTTTTLNLGAALALKGKKILLVDLDPQANLTRGLGLRAAGIAQSIYELLLNPKVNARALIQHSAWENLDLIPSHIDVSGAEIELVPLMGRETRLRRALESVRGDYDYIFIDCLPSLSLLTVNAMVVASEVLVPLQAHPFALEGLGKLFEIIGMLREALNPDLRVSGVLVTLFDSRTNVSRETLSTLKQDERLAPHLFETIVRTNIKIAESQKDGVPVVHFDPNCAGARAYSALCEEVLEMEASGCTASEARARINRSLEAPDQAQPKTPTAREPAPGPPAPEAPAAPAAPEAPTASVPSVEPTAPAAPGASEVSKAPPETKTPPESAEEPETSITPPAPATPPGPRKAPRKPKYHAAEAPATERLRDIQDPSFRPRLRLVPYEAVRSENEDEKKPQ